MTAPSQTPPTQTPTDPAHRVFCPSLKTDLSTAGGGSITVDGPEAHHALRVKRLREGDAVELFDGAGHTLAAVYTSWRGSRQNPVMSLEARGPIAFVGPVSPRVEVFCPPPKPERLGPMIDQLSQIGVAAWMPLSTARTQGSAHDFKRDKLERVVVEAAKQSRRAWLMEIGEPVFFEHAVGLQGAVLFDASGEPAPHAPPAPPSPPVGHDESGERTVRLLIGPEGGWTTQELEPARQSGVATRRAGPHILRVETAAVVAATTALHDATANDGAHP